MGTLGGDTFKLLQRESKGLTILLQRFAFLLATSNLLTLVQSRKVLQEVVPLGMSLVATY